MTQLICVAVASVALVGPATAPVNHTGSPAPIQAQAQPQAPPTDETLKDRIEYRIETSPIVRKYDVDVEVAQGIAKLTGDVATIAQKAEAERLAKIEGVKRVDSTIKVDPNADTSVADRIRNGMNKTGEKITDAWITTKVKWFFMGEDLLKGSDINVDTKDNVVTLKGNVKTQAGRTRAIDLARNTDGVKNVVDQLTVTSTD